MTNFWSAMRWQFGFEKKPDLPSWAEMSEPVADILDSVSKPAASIVRNTGKAADTLENIVEQQRKTIAMSMICFALLVIFNAISLFVALIN